MILSENVLRRLDTLAARHPALNGLRDPIRRAVACICDACATGNKLLVCGNGGSAADSEHIVGELMKAFLLRRQIPESDAHRLRDAGVADWSDLSGKLQRGVPAVALTGHPALASAISNDTDPALVFAQQVYVLGRPGDVLLAISTSGNARNVVRAAQVARAFGLRTIALTGPRPSSLASLCEIVILAPGDGTFEVQEHHLPIYHAICQMVEETLF
jgi:D-sedoheptulose 7-phosphate isomerase